MPHLSPLVKNSVDTCNKLPMVSPVSMMSFQDSVVWHKEEQPLELYCSFSLYLSRLILSYKGLNTKKGFDVKIAAEVSKITGLEFMTAPNKVCILFSVMH
jgi:hypothetical protein